MVIHLIYVCVKYEACWHLVEAYFDPKVAMERAKELQDTGYWGMVTVEEQEVL